MPCSTSWSNYKSSFSLIGCKLQEELAGNEKSTEIFKGTLLCQYLVDCNLETICAAPHHGLPIHEVSALSDVKCRSKPEIKSLQKFSKGHNSFGGL